jgi:hypothetical protein
MESVDKLTIADEMIEAAIEAFLTHKRYFSALNLAGVAEEFYGKYIRICGDRDIQMETIEAAGKLSNIHGGPETPIKEWKNIANHLKNAVKHFDSERDRYVDIDAEDEARSMIGDALSNHAKLDRPVTPTIQRFYDYGREWAVNNAHIYPL